MMIVHTLTGSIYEFDPGARKVRRLSGFRDPTKRQGEDGEWRSYEKVWVELFGSLVIAWEIDGCIVRSTITSPITKLVRDDNVEAGNDKIDTEALAELVGEKDADSLRPV